MLAPLSAIILNRTFFLIHNYNERIKTLIFEGGDDKGCKGRRQAELQSKATRVRRTKVSKVANKLVAISTFRPT